MKIIRFNVIMKLVFGRIIDENFWLDTYHEVKKIRHYLVLSGAETNGFSISFINISHGDWSPTLHRKRNDKLQFNWLNNSNCNTGRISYVIFC